MGLFDGLFDPQGLPSQGGGLFGGYPWAMPIPNATGNDTASPIPAAPRNMRPTPIGGGAFGGLNYRPLGWDAPLSEDEVRAAGLAKLRAAFAAQHNPVPVQTTSESPMMPMPSPQAPQGALGQATPPMPQQTPLQAPQGGATPSAPSNMSHLAAGGAVPGPASGSSPGIGDRLNAGLMGFAHGDGPIGAVANLISGIATGQRQDPVGYARELQQQAQRAAYQAVIGGGGSQAQALAAASNPDVFKALIPDLFGAPKVVKTGEDRFEGKNFMLQQGNTFSPIPGQSTLPLPDASSGNLAGVRGAALNARNAATNGYGAVAGSPSMARGINTVPVTRGNSAAPAAPPAIQEGATATNPRTGQKIIMKNGQWVPQ
jgi:hypothetical protein